MHDRDLKGVALRALLLAQILILGFIERMIPFDFAVPGVKLGLANAVVLAGLYLVPFWDIFVIVLLKCVLGAILFGSAASLIYSLSGQLLSFFCMYITVSKLGPLIKQKISPIGVSVVGAVFHNLGQLAAAVCLMGTFSIILYLPVLAGSRGITGLIVGVAVKGVLGRLTKL